MNNRNSDIEATRQFLEPAAQERVRELTQASVLIAAHIAAARFRDKVDTDPAVCAQIGIAAGTIAGSVIALARAHIEEQIRNGQ